MKSQQDTGQPWLCLVLPSMQQQLFQLPLSLPRSIGFVWRPLELLLQHKWVLLYRIPFCLVLLPWTPAQAQCSGKTWPCCQSLLGQSELQHLTSSLNNTAGASSDLPPAGGMRSTQKQSWGSCFSSWAALSPCGKLQV